MQQDSGNDASSYILPQIINIENVESLASEFKNFLSSKKTFLTLDAANVENITTSGLQLIVSLEKIMLALGGGVVVKNCSENFVSALKDEGLENLLNGGS